MDEKQVARDREAFLAALDDLDASIEASAADAERIRVRVAELREALAAGRPLREVVPQEEPPLAIQLITDIVNRMHVHGNRVRRIEAKVLHGEGLTMDRIAALFGVTRQRVSALLRERPDAP